MSNRAAVLKLLGSLDREPRGKARQTRSDAAGRADGDGGVRGIKGAK